MPKHKLTPQTFALFSKLFIEARKAAKAPKEIFLKPADKQRLLNHETAKAKSLDTSTD